MVAVQEHGFINLNRRCVGWSPVSAGSEGICGLSRECQALVEEADVGIRDKILVVVDKEI